ncbi:hypothetical protein [Novosphingobium colocasiae]|uniref:hypothetical protein n=1 Tax=Novosphingobium colocasiae TaxID=1256513 RepID=UPI0035B2D767
MATLSQNAPLPTAIKASPRALAQATLAAAGVAAIALTLFVLPAEYGIDPTGLGEKLGIAGMATGGGEEESAPAEAEAAPAAATATPAPTRAAIDRATPWRQDEMTVTLEPHSGMEVKAHMAKGDSYVFSWKSTGGPVKVDMHGERTNAPEGEFTSYWKERSAQGQQGVFTAPVDGTHGWYWRNKGESPITITVKVSGFYKDLFKP